MLPFDVLIRKVNALKSADTDEAMNSIVQYVFAK